MNEEAKPQEEAELQQPQAPVGTITLDTDRKKELLESIGLSISVIEQWKGQFGTVEMTKIGGEYYIYRSMNRKEYRDMIEQNLVRNQNEEYVMRRCVLHPKIDELILGSAGPAGLPSSISTLVMEISQFAPDEAPIRL